MNLTRKFISNCSFRHKLIRLSSVQLSNQATNETHFGFETVLESEKEERVHAVFENVAEKYDVMNDSMSFGVHRLWKDYFIDRMAPTDGTKLLDVAGGTGDIAFRFLKYLGNEQHLTGKVSPKTTDESRFDIKIPDNITSHLYGDIERNENVNNNEEHSFTSKSSDNNSALSHVTVCDINQAMLNVGRKRAEDYGYKAGISWLQGNAESLPVTDNSFDAYTIAFGIRNCTHIDQVLKEAYRVLKPGGRFMCLEFSRVSNPVLRRLYDEYSFQVIPVLGQLIASDWKSYQYLVESIRKFPDQESFASMIKQAGFKAVTYENISFGVSAIHSGFKL